MQSASAGKPRLLFLSQGPIYPDTIPVQEKFRQLSEFSCGDIITPVTEPVASASIGEFRLNTLPYYRIGLFRNTVALLVILFRGLTAAARHGRFDVIVSPNPLGTGLVALLLSRLMGAGLLVEVNGNFETAFRYGSSSLREDTWVSRLKERIAHNLIPFVLRRAARVRLLYRNQLVPLGITFEQLRAVAFPDFVPVRRFLQAEKHDRDYLLLLGYPWYLKGVDILIRAFHRISARHPALSLKVVGWCPEGREYFERLAAGHPGIELHDAVEYDQVIELMANCSIYVLASRTEAQGRVLSEAMACGKPIVAANVGGVPEIIRDGFNGLLFDSENDRDLADKLERVLADRELASTLAANGLAFVQEYLAEDVYFDNFRAMIQSICADRQR